MSREGERLGDYELLEELGRGAMGTVWRARQAGGREVALKLLLPARAASPAARARFGREARALTRLRHPHLVGVLDAGVLEGTPYLALELVEGESLQVRLDRAGPLPVAEAVGIARGLAEALAHAHAQGVLHRDLKPGNVLQRSGDGRALLSDFGLARDLLFPDGLTVSGQALGTPGYWAPEQARGEQAALGPWSDVYGLGATLVALLTGAPPHGVPESMVHALAALDRPPPPPSLARPEVDPGLDAVCLRCLAPDPTARFASASELAGALAGWEARRGSAARVPGSHTAASLLAASVLLLGVVLAVVVVLRRSTGPAARPPTGLGPVRVADAGSATPASDPAATVTSSAPPAAAPDEAAREAALVHASRGSELQARHEFEAALAEHGQALALDPGCVHALLARSVIRQLQGDTAAGLEDVQRALAVDPSNPQAWLHRAMLRAVRGEDPHSVVGDLDRALALDPELGGAWSQRGGLRLGLGDLEGARQDLDRALALEPDDALSLVHRGDLRCLQGDPDGARADYDRALTLDPDMAWGRSRRGMLRLEQRDLPGARQDLDRALALDPTAELHHLRGLVSALEGDDEAALAHQERALALDPGFYRARFEAGRIRGGQGLLQEALADFEEVLRLSPGQPEALAARGQVRFALGQREEGLRDVRAALEALPEGSPQALLARDWLAERGER